MKHLVLLIISLWALSVYGGDIHVESKKVTSQIANLGCYKLYHKFDSSYRIAYYATDSLINIYGAKTFEANSSQWLKIIPDAPGSPITSVDYSNIDKYPELWENNTYTEGFNKTQQKFVVDLTNKRCKCSGAILVDKNNEYWKTEIYHERIVKGSLSITYTNNKLVDKDGLLVDVSGNVRGFVDYEKSFVSIDFGVAKYIKNLEFKWSFYRLIDEKSNYLYPNSLNRSDKYYGIIRNDELKLIHIHDKPGYYMVLIKDYNGKVYRYPFYLKGKYYKQ